MTQKFIPVVFALALVIGVGVANAESWLGYHWARTTSSFTLEYGDNVSTVWDTHLTGALADWSTSAVFDGAVKAGKTTSRNCQPTIGRVEVCNYKYGLNNWMGLTQVWVQDGTHITQATVQMNDSYFTQAAYNTSEWRRQVMCHELGHSIGLDHQDEDFYNFNLGTCLDYSTDPSTNQHPNQADYDTLTEVYGHLDTFSTVLASAGGGKPSKGRAIAPDEDLTQPNAWGKLTSDDAKAKHSTYTRDLGNGLALVTFVTWAE